MLSRSRAATLAFGALLSAFVVACVTINVYFPEAAAERAADRIIEEVWGPEAGAGNDQTYLAPQGADQTILAAWRERTAIEAQRAAIGLLDLVVPAANAQVSAADLDINTPEVRALTDSMNKRFRDLKPLFDAGAVGLTSDALIDIRDRNAVPLSQRSKLSQLVTAENGDRNRLYAAIAKANGHPEWEDGIRRTFADRWVARASGGWYYRTSSGEWRAK
ncbi:MAG: DUF1318 domain-containing protein [Pseudomonadota bacterium]